MTAIYLYTGNGAGKTTNALGLALRAIGQGFNVLVIQFLKWDKNTGEWQFQWRMPDALEVHQFGREGWHGFNNLTQEDRDKCLEGLQFAGDLINRNEGRKRFDLLILDEINLAVYLKLLTVDEVENFLFNRIPIMNIVMTGRHATKELMDLADVVNVVCEVKAPKKFIYEKGIQY